jgi:hypothetical protein
VQVFLFRFDLFVLIVCLFTYLIVLHRHLYLKSIYYGDMSASIYPWTNPADMTSVWLRNLPEAVWRDWLFIPNNHQIALNRKNVHLIKWANRVLQDDWALFYYAEIFKVDRHFPWHANDYSRLHGK